MKEFFLLVDVCPTRRLDVEFVSRPVPENVHHHLRCVQSGGKVFGIGNGSRENPGACGEFLLGQDFDIGPNRIQLRIARVDVGSGLGILYPLDRLFDISRYGLRIARARASGLEFYKGRIKIIILVFSPPIPFPLFR